jgi:Domain of unknown function (DUF4388)
VAQARIEDLLSAIRAGSIGLLPDLRRVGAGDAVLAGSLTDIPTSDLLNFLHQGRHTGVLLVRSIGAERAVALIEGNVAWGASTSPAERVGELICKMGLVDRATVQEVLRAQAQSGQRARLGQALIQRGLISPQDLSRALRHQSVEIFLGLLVLDEGEFVLLRGCDAKRLPVTLGMDTEALLLDGLRRLDEMVVFRSRVPGLHVTPRSTGKALAGNEVEGARTVLPLCDGARSVAQIAIETALGEFETMRAIYKLLGSGHLALR